MRGGKERFCCWRVAVWTIVVFGAVAAVAVVWMQPKLTFNPEPTLIATPAVYGLEYEEIRLVQQDMTVAGWLVRTDEPEVRGTVLFCPPGMGNRSYELDTALFFTSAGMDVLLFDYPGFAESRGRLCGKNCYEATRRMFDLLLERDAPRPLLVYGRGRGAALAGRLVGERPVDGLVVERHCPAEMELEKKVFGFAGVLMQWRFPVDKYLDEVSVPLFFVQRDDPRSEMAKLARFLDVEGRSWRGETMAEQDGF